MWTGVADCMTIWLAWASCSLSVRTVMKFLHKMAYNCSCRHILSACCRQPFREKVWQGAGFRS